jgi:hypothetical protein
MGRPPVLTTDRLMKATSRHTVRRGTPPSVEDLCRSLGGVSTRTVFRYLRLLDGAVERRPGISGVKALVTARRRGPMPMLTEGDYILVSELKAVRIAKDAIRSLIHEEVQDDLKVTIRHLRRIEETLERRLHERMYEAAEK